MGSLASEQKVLLVTGSNGFLGQAIVCAAVARGHSVRCVVRSTASIPEKWAAHKNVRVIECALGDPTAVETLLPAIHDVDVIVHAAAGMSGDDLQHIRNTIQPTEAIISALAALRQLQSPVPDLVLISSLSVYSGTDLPCGSSLDEHSVLETNPQARDAYCRAKLQQETLVNCAAREHDLNVRILRPGAIFGKGRLWNAHLGHGVGPVLAQMESRGEVPLSFVDHCAAAVVLAAEVPVVNDDRGAAERDHGCVEFINVIDDDRPTRFDYVSALRASGWPKVVLPLSWRVLAKLAKFLHSAGLSGRMPGLLREPVLHSRMKPLTYSNERLKDRLGWTAAKSFKQAMQSALDSERSERAD